MAECSHWVYVHDLEATVTSLLPDTIEIKTAIDTTIISHVPVRHTLGGVAAMTQRAHLTGWHCGIVITAHLVIL